MLDQNTDTTLHILYDIISENPGIKNHVKTASIGEEVRWSLPSSCFADTDNRLYPIHTRADAILSKSYATKVANIAPHILRSIDNALDMFSVPSSVFATSEKVASTKDKQKTYILPGRKALAITGSSNIKLAEERFLAVKSKLSSSEQSEGAIRLVKAANVMGESVSADTLQLAGVTRSDLDKAADWIEARVHVSKTPVQAGIYSKVAEALRVSTSATREDLVKVAGLIDELDSLNGVKHLYGKYLPTPTNTIFNTKVAMHDCVYINGKELPLTKLQSMDPKTFGDIVGDDIVPEISDNSGNIDVEKFSEIVDTLPKDMKDLIVKKLGL
jgi:hypothetical protein